MNASVKQGVGNAAEIELPVHQLQRQVALAEPFVEHDLGDVDRPPFGEDTRAKGGTEWAWRLIGSGELQVVARDRLVNREERQHAVVVFAHLRLNLLRVGVVRRRCYVEEALLATIERARRIKECTSIGTQEERRPHDLKRLFRQVNEPRFANERFAACGFGTRSIQHLIWRTVITADSV